MRVPSGLSGSGVPLVVGLHGASSSGSTFEAYAGLNSFAQQKGFIVAYGEALPNGSGFWQTGQGSPDVEYLRDVVADISAEWCVNPRRVHAAGHSRGGVMAARVACDAADLFASVASYGGSDVSLSDTPGPCTPSRPISTGWFAGLLDPIQLASRFAADTWAARNACPGPTTQSSLLGRTRTFSPCAAGTRVVHHVYNFQSHNWPVGSDLGDILNRMWSLFESSPRPG